MSLRDYFQNTKGTGILATSDSSGKVNVAVYSRPHYPGDDEQELAFIMADRLSHENLQSNPQAAYLFTEHGEGYNGKRLFLTKTREESDPDKIAGLRRRNLPPECEGTDGKTRYLVYFRVDGTRPLIGTATEE